MRVELTNDEARFLIDQLAKHAAELDDELVHTDKRALQQALARDLDYLRVIEGKLERALSVDDKTAS